MPEFNGVPKMQHKTYRGTHLGRLLESLLGISS